MSIENLKTFDPFADADADDGPARTEGKQADYVHIRIQQRNGRKTLTTVQGLPSKFDRKKILTVIKKKFACNGTVVTDSNMGEVIQLQGDQRKNMRTSPPSCPPATTIFETDQFPAEEFLVDKEGLQLKAATIKVHGF
ncbi:translation initiation factor SU [Xylariomycetidae sp. FL0641]|nr:translation initiation factor SU [Xylariomycetidae sp. FL0641]